MVGYYCGVALLSPCISICWHASFYTRAVSILYRACVRLWKDVQRPQGFYKTWTAALNWNQWYTAEKSHSPPTFPLTSTPCIHPRRVLRFTNFHASKARREIFSAWLSCSILWMERRKSLPANISKYKAKNPQSKDKVSERKSRDSTVDISNILWFRLFSSIQYNTIQY